MHLSSRLGLMAALTATLVLGACSSTPVGPGEKASPPVAVKPGPVIAQAATVPVSAKPIPAYLDGTSALYQKRSIYFDFDEFTVKPGFSQVLELHGKYLASHPNVAIKVQGNTDEQGGTEYNLALGQKRAEAVTKALKIYGVKDTQLEAVSFGKEKPKANGHDEAAHAQNRRADLAYPEK